MEKYKVFSMISYVAMGWCVLLVIGQVVRALGLVGSIFLLLGGVLYTSGIIFFGMRKKYFHSIWHLFVLAGSIFHYFCIFFYVV